jgi:hypothetical protein
MRGAHGMYGGLKYVYKSHLQDLGIDWRIQLNWIFKKLRRPRLNSSGSEQGKTEVLVKTVMIFWFTSNTGNLSTT